MNITVEAVLDGELVLCGATPAVAACFVEDLDPGTAGIIASDIDTDYVLSLSDFEVGDWIYFESQSERDCLDDSTPELVTETHIWWLGRIAATDA